MLEPERVALDDSNGSRSSSANCRNVVNGIAARNCSDTAQSESYMRPGTELEEIETGLELV